MRARGVVAALGTFAFLAASSCSSREGSAVTSPITLTFVGPKGVLDDADTVSLTVSSGTSCKGPDLKPGGALVGEPHPLSKPGAANKCSTDGKQWCVSFDVKQDPATTLSWYVEGSALGKKTFRGCTDKAVDQNDVTIPITIVRYVDVAKCGDGVVGATETCETTDAADEVCDITTCQTKEVIVGNGEAAHSYFKGLPGRKTGVAMRWLDDGKLFVAWADKAMNGGGGDASDEITWRRLTADLKLDMTLPAVIQKEIRLQTFSRVDFEGQPKKRAGANVSPSIVPVEGGNVLVVFGRATSNVFASLQAVNMGKAPADDVTVSGGAASSPAAAAGATPGDVLVTYVEGTAIKSSLRKPDGTFVAAQTVSSSGSNSAPRVAFTGSDYVVVWTDGDDIKLRHVGTDGVPKGSEAVVNSVKTGTQNQPSVAALTSGEFAVVWASSGADGDDGTDIRVQRFDASGPVGTEATAPLDDVNHKGDQAAPSIAAGVTGAAKFYIVGWLDGDRGVVAARYISAAGGFLFNNVAATKSEFDVSVAAGPVSSPSVVVGAGYCAVAWANDADGDPAADDDRVRARRLPLPPPP